MKGLLFLQLVISVCVKSHFLPIKGHLALRKNIVKNCTEQLFPSHCQLNRSM